MDARDIASLVLASNTGMYHPRAVLIDPVLPNMPYEEVPGLTPAPTYPEINPTYPGPFLRDPAELNTDDEWRTRV